MAVSLTTALSWRVNCKHAGGKKLKLDFLGMIRSLLHCHDDMLFLDFDDGIALAIGVLGVLFFTLVCKACNNLLDLPMIKPGLGYTF